MMVIIPHETELLKLVKFQKQLIKDLNSASTIYAAHQPLWIEFSHEQFKAESQADLKLLSKRIISIELEKLSQSDEKIIAVVKIKTDIADIMAELPLLHLYKGSPKSADIEFPFKKIKIFRLGIPEDLSENSKAIIESVWCKL